MTSSCLYVIMDFHALHRLSMLSPIILCAMVHMHAYNYLTLFAYYNIIIGAELITIIIIITTS